MSTSREEFRQLINDNSSYLVALTAVTLPDFDILTVYEPDQSVHGIFVILDYYRCMNDFIRETGATYIEDGAIEHENAHSKDKGEDNVLHSHLKLPKNYISSETFIQFVNKLNQCGAGFSTNGTAKVLSSSAVEHSVSAFEACRNGDTTRCITGYDIGGKTHQISQMKNPYSHHKNPFLSAPHVNTATTFTAKNTGYELLSGGIALAGLLACTLFGKCLRSRSKKTTHATVSDEVQYKLTR